MYALTEDDRDWAPVVLCERCENRFPVDVDRVGVVRFWSRFRHRRRFYQTCSMCGSRVFVDDIPFDPIPDWVRFYVTEWRDRV